MSNNSTDSCHQRGKTDLEECVLQLDIPISDTHLVAVVHPEDELLEKPSCFALLQRTGHRQITAHFTAHFTVHFTVHFNVHFTG